MNAVTSVPLPFAIQPGETVQQGFVRVLGQMAVQARRRSPPTHEARGAVVHETRVSIKRLRALLWFAAPAFSTTDLLPLKEQLRRASQLLGAQRDRVVLQTVVEKLSRTTANTADRLTLDHIVDAPKDLRAKATKAGRSLRQAVAILLSMIKEVAKKAASRSRWPDPSDRLALAFFTSAKAGKKALHRQKSAQFHEWRKKAKRLLYQLLFTQASPGKQMLTTIERVDDLQEKLGDNHDGVIAQDRLQELLPDRLPSRFVKRSIKLLKKRRRALREEVRKLAGQIKMKPVRD